MESQLESRVFPRIKALRAFIPDEPSSQGADCHDVTDEHWINGFPTPIANPMSAYPMYAATRKSWGINALGTVIAEVEAEDGTLGYGISIGGQPGM